MSLSDRQAGTPLVKLCKHTRDNFSLLRAKYSVLKACVNSVK